MLPHGSGIGVEFAKEFEISFTVFKLSDWFLNYWAGVEMYG